VLFGLMPNGAYFIWDTQKLSAYDIQKLYCAGHTYIGG